MVHCHGEGDFTGITSQRKVDMKLQTSTRVQAPALNTIVVREIRIDETTALNSAIVEGVVDDRPVSPVQPNLFRKQQKI